MEMIREDAALDWEKITQAFEAFQSQSQPALEVRSPSANFVIESQEGDQSFDPQIQASAEYTIEAIEFGAKTIAAIFSSWTADFADSVIGWMQIHANEALDRIKKLLPESKFPTLAGL